MSFSVSGQEYKEKVITVVGSSELTIPAEKAEFNYYVQGLGKSLKSAIEDAKLKVESTTEKLQKIGIPKNNINISYFNSNENNGFIFFSSDEDYKTSITIHVIVDSLNKLEPALISLSSNQVERVSEVSFSLRSESFYKDKVLENAVGDAKQKAERILSKLGAVIDSPLSVDIISSDGSSYENIRFNKTSNSFRSMKNANNQNNFMVGDDFEGIFSGTIPQTFTISSSVRIIFRIK